MASAKVMFQFKHPGAAPSLSDVAQRFGVRRESLDEEFGAIETDPSEHLYTVLMDADQAQIAASKLTSDNPAEGAFSNPRVEPFDL